MEEILKECPRHEMKNPRNYTNMELEMKTKRVKVLHQDYPNVPEYWLDMLYDYLAKKDDKTLEKMVNEDTHGEPAINPRTPVPAENGIKIEKSAGDYSREIAFEGVCDPDGDKVSFEVNENE
tara:strand:+ start:39 stop:404 length:366 start_codon:yes stop_codon:yes gene_type:complete